jgi:2-haloacid dehalogenase
MVHSTTPAAQAAAPPLPRPVTKTTSTSIELLVFDVFGTVVDWHGSIVAELQTWAPQLDADAFALAWRAGYQPAMQRVRSGQQGWTRIDDLHRGILEELLPAFGLAHLSEPERVHLNRVWHRLNPWPDVRAGLKRLRQRYRCCTLSNGNVGLLSNLSRHGGLQWDAVLSAELYRAYKPQPEVYIGAAATFDLQPSQVMLVAAHHDDLAAARACGLQTAYVERPLEFGAGHVKDVSPVAANTLHARDFGHLADQLHCH